MLWWQIPLLFISKGLDIYISRRHDRDTPSPKQPLCRCTSVPGQRLLWTPGNTKPGGCKTSQMGGCQHHQIGRRRTSPYQPLHSDPEGGFTRSLPTALTHRALALTTAHAQSRFALWEVHLNSLHVLQRCGHSIHGTRPDNALYLCIGWMEGLGTNWERSPTCSCHTMLPAGPDTAKQSELGWNMLQLPTSTAPWALHSLETSEMCKMFPLWLFHTKCLDNPKLFHQMTFMVLMDPPSQCSPSMYFKKSIMLPLLT